MSSSVESSSSSISRSVVSGDLVSAAPAKTIEADAVAGPAGDEVASTFLATSRRFLGAKSSAPMVPETSSTSWMSIPSVLVSSQA